MFTLKSLPYSEDALEPVISKKTIEFHYGKHHQGYVNNLNKLIKDTEFEEMSLEEIIQKAEGGIFNNAAQVWNHTFFWESMCPMTHSSLTPELRQKFEAHFGSMDEFRSQFSKAATTLFGSGWVWLAISPEGKWEIIQESNAGNPLTKGYKPILTLDVWEHAYYLDYQNRRPDFVENFWRIVNWQQVENRIG